MVPPGCSAPDCSAARIIFSAMRSLTDPPGLRYSILASISGATPAATGPSRTSGVLPIKSTMVSAYRTEVLLGGSRVDGRGRTVRLRLTGRGSPRGYQSPAADALFRRTPGDGESFDRSSRITQIGDHSHRGSLERGQERVPDRHGGFVASTFSLLAWDVVTG